MRIIKSYVVARIAAIVSICCFAIGVLFFVINSGLVPAYRPYPFFTRLYNNFIDHFQSFIYLLIFKREYVIDSIIFYILLIFTGFFIYVCVPAKKKKQVTEISKDMKVVIFAIRNVKKQYINNNGKIYLSNITTFFKNKSNFEKIEKEFGNLPEYDKKQIEKIVDQLVDFGLATKFVGERLAIYVYFDENKYQSYLSALKGELNIGNGLFKKASKWSFIIPIIGGVCNLLLAAEIISNFDFYYSALIGDGYAMGGSSTLKILATLTFVLFIFSMIAMVVDTVFMILHKKNFNIGGSHDKVVYLFPDEVNKKEKEKIKILKAPVTLNGDYNFFDK